jgi:cob(I)alamin adenosyltransferase
LSFSDLQRTGRHERTTVAGQCRILTDFADVGLSDGSDGENATSFGGTLPAMSAEQNDDGEIAEVTATQPLSDDPRPPERSQADSLLLVNTGSGKGKSSAAFGVMLRSVAAGWPVAVVQFIKSGKWKVGEEKIGRQLGVEWHSVGQGFTWDSSNIDHDKQLAAAGWDTARQTIESGRYRLVILDELTYLCTWGWIDTDEVVATLASRPPKTSVIVTGRDCPQAIIDIADTVTEMRKLKHAYDQGINAKRGIEY